MFVDIWDIQLAPMKAEKQKKNYRYQIDGFHAISGDTNNNGEMNKCWWTNKAS